MKGVRAIGTEADYDSALTDIERYFVKQPEPGILNGGE
jgi:antitoxin component HigA of HigAB toxin-antitoxin module